MRPAEDMRRLFKKAELIDPSGHRRTGVRGCATGSATPDRKTAGHAGKDMENDYEKSNKETGGRRSRGDRVCDRSVSLERDRFQCGPRQVLEPHRKVSAYRYQMDSTSTVQVSGMTIQTDQEMTSLVSNDHGIRMTLKLRTAQNGPESVSEMYMLPQKGVLHYSYAQ